MMTFYRIEAEQIVQCAADSAQVFVYCQPSDEEKQALKRSFNLDPLDLESVFDADEVPRIEILPDGVFMIWKRPDNVSVGEAIQFDVSSFGLAIRKDKVALIVPRGEFPMSGREFKKIRSIWDCVFRSLLFTIHHYLGHLKAIRMMSQDLQAKIVTSMENKYLLQMFALSESLVYYYNALESNLAVLAKIRTIPDKLSLNSEEIALLDDLIIENQQAAKQANIYSTVLSGLMDARGSIINNNMGVLLKKLTIINVVFLPLNLIASIGGMSEYSMMTEGAGWRGAYLGLSVAMLSIGWGTWWWLVKVMERKPLRKVKGGI